MNCEKITYFIEKGYLTKLNISEKLQVKLHSSLCKSCRNYSIDSSAINELLTLLEAYDKAEQGFSEDEKEALKKQLENL